MTAVDIIIPTLNGSEWLARCLDSLQRSTFNDYRLIVFDDGSQEAIDPVVYARFSNATIIRSERNVGLARAFNRSNKLSSVTSGLPSLPAAPLSAPAGVEDARET